MSRWFFGFFLAVGWFSVLGFCAEEPLPEVSSPQDVASSVSGTSVPAIDNAIGMAQEEVRDPFAMTFNMPPPEVTASKTQSTTTASSASPEIAVTLQGIGFGSKDAYAVIGGEVFFEGDEKKGIKLLEIRKREVDILVSGGKVTVPLFPDQELQKAKDRAKKKSAVKNASVDKLVEMPSSSGREQL